MKIVDFIRRHQESILSDWDAFAKSQLPAADNMNFGQLRDHAAQILSAIACDMEVEQSREEQSAKSKGDGPPQRMTAVAKTHADLRVNFGFTVEQLMAEFRALRASILRLWSTHGYADVAGMIRFNETIDEAIAESIHHYASVINKYRDRFLMILSQEVTGSLQVLALTTNALKGSDLDASQLRLLAHIDKNAEVIKSSTEELIKLTKGRFGIGF